MILTILISVVLSVIITLGTAYGGFLWYNRKLEAQAKEMSDKGVTPKGTDKPIDDLLD